MKTPMKMLLAVAFCAISLVSCQKETAIKSPDIKTDSTSKPIKVDTVQLSPEDQFIKDSLIVDSSYVDSLQLITHPSGTEPEFYSESQTINGTVYTVRAADKAGNPYAIVRIWLNDNVHAQLNNIPIRCENGTTNGVYTGHVTVPANVYSSISYFRIYLAKPINYIDFDTQNFLF